MGQHRLVNTRFNFDMSALFGDLKSLFESLDPILDVHLAHFLDILLVKRSHLGRFGDQTGAFGIVDTVALMVIGHDLLLALVSAPSIRALFPLQGAVHDLVFGDPRTLQHGHSHALAP